MIEIYGKDNCKWCVEAKITCDQYELEYVYKSCEDFEIMEELSSKLSVVKKLPQIWWNGRHIGGFEDLVMEIGNTRNFGQESL
jgi:glutaredoxin